MKKLGFLLIILSLTVFFSACPKLLEDDEEGDPSGDVIVSDDTLDSYKWLEILEKIAKEGKFVSLDLSKCSYDEKNELGGLIKSQINGEDYIAFDPFPASSSGKNYILSITLPAISQVIINAEDDVNIDDDFNSNEKNIENAKKHSAFRYFKNLRSIKADNITFIGNFAFADCTALTEVVLPRVGHTVTSTEIQDSTSHTVDIGKYAFLGCTSLKRIKFNSAAAIGGYAFKGCTSLTDIDFPVTWMIENNVFEGCTSLVNVFFEKATKIGSEAFKNCINLEKAEFNAAPERFSTGDPIDPPLEPLPDTLPVPPAPVGEPVYDSMIFYHSVFIGCKALKIFNARRAWNVYFSEKVFADTSSSIEIYLFDEPTSVKSFGHPQNTKFLGDGVNLTLREITIVIPTDGEIIENGTSSNSILKFIRKYYTNVDVIPKRRPL